MQVFFGTVVRGAPVSKSGELVRLDWKSKRIVGKIPMYPTNPFTEDDPNARGGTRGCRGITFTGRELVVANYHTLHGYSLDLQKNWEISNGLIANVHELFYSGNGKIWVTSTDIDAVLEYSLETGKLTNEFWPRDTAEFRKTFNLTPGRIDKNADNRLKYRDIPYSKDPSHLHPNALAVWQGQYFALFHSLGVIVNLSKSEVIIEDPSLKGGHNLVILEDGTAIVNSSSDRAIRFYDLQSKRLIQSINILAFPWVQYLLLRVLASGWIMKYPLKALGVITRFSLASPLFLRGLDVVGDLVFAGLSPASIICIDWRRRKLVDVYVYSKSVWTTVHGLKVVPE